MFFEESELIHYADELIYERGLKLYEDNKVIAVKTDVKPWDSTGIKAYILEAKVTGSSDNSYKVQVRFNDKTGFTYFDCDCRYFKDNYRRRGVCKHIIAALIKDKRDEVSNIKQKISDFNFNNLVKNIEANKDLLNRVELKIKPVLEFYTLKKIKANVEFKLEADKAYKVRDIKAFINAYENGEQALVIRDFIYSSYKYFFGNRDRSFISIVREAIEQESLFKQTVDYSLLQHSLIKESKLSCSDLLVKRVFELFADVGIEVIINDRSYGSVPIYINRGIPLDIKLVRNINSYVLTYDSNEPILLSNKGDIVFYKDSIYILDELESARFKVFYEALKTKINIDSNYKEKVKQIILPELIDLNARLNVSDGIRKEFDIDRLKIKFYVDKRKDIIFVKPVFNYGDTSITLKNQKIKNDVVRDKIGERRAIKYLEVLNFKILDDEFFIEQEDHIFDFLNIGATKLREIGEVFYSEGFKSMKLHNKSSYRGDVRLNEKGLLEFDFSMEGVDPRELFEIFRGIKNKKKYYRLANGDFVNLQDDELINVYELLEYDGLNFKRKNFNNIVLPRYKEYLLKEECLSFIKGDNKVIDLNKVNETSIPKELLSVLRVYQKQAFSWFINLSDNGFGGILADEMGLGKTLQAISFLYAKKQNGSSLVIAPSSLVYNWYEEATRFLKDFRVIVVDGNKANREKIIEAYKDYDLLITSYALLRRDQEAFAGKDLNTIIVDEAQYIKNPNSMNAKACKSLKAENKFALTGTPIENNLGDLWSIFDFLMPGYLLSKKRFIVRYETPIVKESKTKALEEFNRRVSPFILRREKSMVAKELPPKIEHNVSIELNDKQKKFYAAYAKAVKKDFKKLDLQINENKFKFLGALTRLRQICSMPEVAFEEYSGENSKLTALLDIINEAKENYKKVIVFSSFTTSLKNIGQKLLENEIKYLYLDGDTKIKDRLPMVNEFNEGSANVFLISLKAGGTGLNITSAEVVIHYDPWWNPAVEDQATDRAHRIGQKNQVEVIRLIARGTIEERIYELQEKKKSMVDLVVGNEEVGNFKVNLEDIKEFI
ncbi:Superfamily II DNA or RNA helicase, SNF2 family [Clostridium cavendishii DSM 21758]|uniref:Superfamily II DNA or RNA helicase, SNF2 family n=1 Tax=Clostridium cavendishii DSM 21758 TaxID=1121302 RepID=A0A1M6PEE9_9CLOT|nr:DEAD/DEAH box helicase [Clostridium cavendishii]SHK06270.1 Superfamily II DNA or RNA helicase, SNF2 family [Clostridium cavendishii DSM 21758]